jgi:predicted NodU family carbamoyl transferase
MKKSIYVLGTGLSHNGSACLLKDGKIVAAIEKERITKIKNDGKNDTAAINYCLEKENIALDEVSLIVQNTPGNNYDAGQRLVGGDSSIPVVTISHHLAHAYSAFGCSGFESCAALVIDGEGNVLEDCMDLAGGNIIRDRNIDADLRGIYVEINSYYRFDKGNCTTICKEFSPFTFYRRPGLRTFTENSIGNLYSAASDYCFRDMFGSGKLMGLAPFGDPTVFKEEIFELKDGNVFIDHSILARLERPSGTYDEFRDNFQYYADFANWIQRETERAVIYIINSRYEMFPSDNLIYSGGVALNAVINGKILANSPFRNLYVQPAAGDNGIALGCAYYGWLEVLKKEKVAGNGTTCFGKIYSTNSVKESLGKFGGKKERIATKKAIDGFFNSIPQLSKNEEKQREEKVIQFNVQDAGIYQVKINGEGVESKNDIIGEPTCEVWVHGNDLYDGLANRSYFNTLLELKKIGITKHDDLDYLLKIIEFDKPNGVTWLKDPNTAMDLIHYEGEGYIEEAARLLAAGKIIGWFQDESEFGPRALGRRSILADPRKKGVKDFINAEIKFREDFRPFAPSVLLEDASLYFDIQGEAPYMLKVCQIKDEWREKLEDIVHKDGSCRVQTVTSDWNPKYDCLLREFKRLTGISVLLNTSFNGRAMPIVETPDDALGFFYRGKLDYLVMQDLIVKQRG